MERSSQSAAPTALLVLRGADGQNVVVRTERGFDRVINFSDAVVAIALTLLVLPLVDLPAGYTEGTNLGTLLSQSSGELTAFGISFVVIWRLWVVHHRILECYRGYDQLLLALNFGWLLTIVFLPFPTALLSTDLVDRGATPLYIGVLLVSVLLLAGIAELARRRPQLTRSDDEQVRVRLGSAINWVPPGLLVVALLLSLVVPRLGPWSLLVLVLTPAVGRLRARLRRR